MKQKHSKRFQKIQDSLKFYWFGHWIIQINRKRVVILLAFTESPSNALNNKNEQKSVDFLLIWSCFFY